MKLRAKFIKTLPIQSGNNKTSAWTKQDFVVETNDSYTKKVVLTNWNNKFDLSKLTENTFYDFEVVVESNAFNGSYYSAIVLNETPIITDKAILSLATGFKPFSSSARIVEFLPEKTGSGWSKKDVVFEQTSNGNRRFCVSFLNNKIDLADFSVGDNVTLEFFAESREYNGRWYTDLKAWKIEILHKGSGGTTEQYDDTDPNSWPF